MNVILNADDFGRSREINRAILRAHREGVLTSASLMVGGEAFDDAVEIAHANPSLAVGLHIVVVDGPAVLPHQKIPHLVDSDGCFPTDPVRVGLKYALVPAAKRQLAVELRAQFEKFARTGLSLSHVDGHLHMHVHPVVFRHVVALAEQFGAKGLRLPRESIDLRQGAARVMMLRIMSRWCERRLRRTSLAVPSRTYGAVRSGQMEEDYVVSVLSSIAEPSEIYFHPTTGQRLDALGPNPGDLATLLSPRVRRIVHDRGLRLSTYFNLNGTA